jgi:hypothetical protein
MVHLIQSDFRSNRLAAVAFAVIIGLGIACWFQASHSRDHSATRSAEPQQLTVLPDPFEKK